MLDLSQHLLRQMAFSRATFGPAERRDGVIEHIRKELAEVATADTPMARHREWTDVVILALDGLTRSLRTEGYSPRLAAEKACELILEKQSVNESRDWPDWRGMPTDKAIEHVRIQDDEKAGAQCALCDASGPDTELTWTLQHKKWLCEACDQILARTADEVQEAPPPRAPD